MVGTGTVTQADGILAVFLNQLKALGKFDIGLEGHHVALVPHLNGDDDSVACINGGIVHQQPVALNRHFDGWNIDHSAGSVADKLAVFLGCCGYHNRSIHSGTDVVNGIIRRIEAIKIKHDVAVACCANDDIFIGHVDSNLGHGRLFLYRGVGLFPTLTHLLELVIDVVAGDSEAHHGLAVVHALGQRMGVHLGIDDILPHVVQADVEPRGQFTTITGDAPRPTIASRSP